MASDIDLREDTHAHTCTHTHKSKAEKIFQMIIEMIPFQAGWSDRFDVVA